MADAPDPPQPEFYAYTQPRWAGLLKAGNALWTEAKRKAGKRGQPRVLIATSLGGHVAMTTGGKRAGMAAHDGWNACRKSRPFLLRQKSVVPPELRVDTSAESS